MSPKFREQSSPLAVDQLSADDLLAGVSINNVVGPGGAKALEGRAARGSTPSIIDQASSRYS